VTVVVVLAVDGLPPGLSLLSPFARLTAVNGTVGQGHDGRFFFGGGIAPDTWSISGGALPPRDERQHHQTTPQEWRYSMKRQLSSFARLPRPLLVVIPLVAATAALMPISVSAAAPPARATAGGTVSQTNLVSDLPGVASVQDPNLVNPWGISESASSPFWLSDNNAGVSTLYGAAAGANPPVSINPLVVDIPTPVNSQGGGTPTGTVFNTASSSGAFKITGTSSGGTPISDPATFLFDTEDGTISGWNPSVNPTHAIIAVDNSGNNFTNPDPNQQTGAVYKGLAIATSSTPIVSGDPNSTALLYAANFRAGTIDVYDAAFTKVTGLSAGAFTDRALPHGYAPFNVQVLDGKVYVTYALQDASKHDNVAGPGRGFVDVFNLNGSPGLPGGAVRLLSRGPLNSPWGLAIAPQGFAGLSAPHNDPVLLVGNFGDGLINAFDATNGSPLGQLKDPNGNPIQINGLWALQVGNGGSGGNSQAVYFTAGPFGESHGLFGSLSTAAPGSSAGPAAAQWVQANADVVQLDGQQLVKDSANGASAATIGQDTQTLKAASLALLGAERAFAQDNSGYTPR
jgi:uncharacterized protein (TIGR03118 family)